MDLILYFCGEILFPVQKPMLLIRGLPRETREAFRKRIFLLVNRILSEEKPAQLSLTLTTDAPSSVHVIPFRQSLMAAVSVFRDDPCLLRYRLFSGLQHDRNLSDRGMDLSVIFKANL